ncbi:RagB/SusD family nutrient uptake outer membrane protein [Flavobacterium soyangense]|uniref:RagB/SusD family nutrient uptake outer membrane protein n=1 Tax=Flavobacterium soyangense TaxID=2023265 RepID=A0A930U9W1_9FLAO|nr:RagB/SusD family nutrient uptake outer membrane protein [Flavobacterium soyangense]MBF2709628.1 RagB/SusD family nutrient uptake outer membrane protein [Flavobacterium soyangense]
MKNKIIKFKWVLIASLILSTQYSCSDDILNTLPLGVAVKGDLTTGGFEATAFGLYGKLRTSNVASWNRYWLGSIRSDDAAKGSSPGDAAAEGNVFDSFQYISTDGISTDYWNDHYSLIYACNDLINDVDTSGLTDNGTLVNKAEARVIRAFAYFDLRRDYGQVPIVANRIVNVTDGIKPKSTIAQVDTFIIADLEYAIQYLPTTWPSYPGRATKGFANSLLAKLYLYQKDYTKAYAKCQEVINSGVYSLNPSFKDEFNIQGNNSSESIFEVQQLITAANVYYSNIYYVSQGVRGTGVWDLGWGFNIPTTNLIAAFETNDPRYNHTILTSGQDDGGYGGGVLPASPPLDQKYWNKKAYTEASTRTKYNQNQNNWENIKLLRFADVLLMDAEAANELGNSASAISDIELIRARARGGNNAVLPKVTTTDKSLLRDAIKHERRIEFAMENERFYDLVRWGDASSFLGGLGYQNKNEFLPIPQTAIDKSGGVLVQNPNY